MNLSEASKALGIRRDALRDIITLGIEINKTVVKLNAVEDGKDYFISDDDFDAFQKLKEEYTPGRNTPIAMIRELKVESNMLCGICVGNGPLEYHHIIEFSQINHYDFENMMAICSNCHTRIGRGEIDHKQQKMHKAKLKSGFGAKVVEIFGNNSPVIIKWEDISRVIISIELEWNYDGTDIIATDPNKPLAMDEKNDLNHMNSEYFNMIKHNHEPYFEKIREFLANPVNKSIIDNGVSMDW